MELKNIKNDVINEYPIGVANDEILNEWWMQPGGVAQPGPYYQTTQNFTIIFQITSVILLITSIILTFIKKFKPNSKLTSKKIKILYILTIISIILLILSTILFYYLS